MPCIRSTAVVACGWIKRGKSHAARADSGRRRVDSNGAIDSERMEPVVRFDDSIDAESTIALFPELEQLQSVSVSNRLSLYSPSSRTA